MAQWKNPDPKRFTMTSLLLDRVTHQMLKNLKVEKNFRHLGMSVEYLLDEATRVRVGEGVPLDNTTLALLGAVKRAKGMASISDAASYVVTEFFASRVG